MWFLYILGGLVVLWIGYSGLKLLFWELPAIVLDAKSFPDYFKKVAFSIIGLGSLFGLFYLGEKDPGTTFIIGMVLFIVLALFFVSNPSNPSNED
jgi:hypothetical protein